MTDIIEILRSGNIDEQAAVAIKAADELTALREMVEVAYRAGYTDGAEDMARDGFTHLDAVNEGWQNFKSAHLLTPESDNG